VILALFLLAATPTDLDVPIVRESLTGTHRRVVRSAAAPPREGIRREIRYHRPLEPFAYDYDVETGRLLQRTPLFFTAKPARVFDPNPVASLNDPSLRDQNDAAAAVPEAAYETVEIDTLDGPHVRLVDIQVPSIPPPSGTFLFNRADDGFEDVSAYVHIDRNQRYLQSLGYTGSRQIVPYAIEVDAHAANGTDNSFFIPSSSQPGRGTLYFGEGGTDDAEDADLIVHEYGHAILEWIAPGTFGGSFGTQARALSEGFGDYWAFSQHYATRAASGRDPYCLADWDARCWNDDASQNCAYAPGSDCLRRVDSTRTMADYDRTDRAGVEHQNGAIWSSALREIHDAVGRTVADTIILESIFDVASQPRFADLAQRMLRADQLLYGGIHASTICTAMTTRGILAECGVTPRGEFTLYQSSDRAVPIADLSTITSTLTITDARTIERALVRVDLEHSSRGDLRIELVAPDGTTITLQSVTIDRATDLHATYGLGATPVESLDALRGRSAAGTWTLRISDQRARDAGTLLSWSLLLQLTGDVRATPRPRASQSQMIPVVAHVFGANDTAFRSDVRLANVTTQPVDATLIFTPSNAYGTSTFSAIHASLAPGQSLAFDDIVESAFATSGSGTLEILGDVIAMSRMYTLRNSGSVGQQIPPRLASGTSLLVASIDDANTRVNLGIANANDTLAIVAVDGIAHLVPPYSHVQFGVARGTHRITSTTNVVAYLSQIDNTTGDAMFIPAEPLVAHDGVAPVIARQGADRQWRSDLWVASDSNALALPLRAIANGATYDATLFPIPQSQTYIDVLARLFPNTVTLAALQIERPSRVFAATRVATDGMSQFIPLLEGDGAHEQQLLFIDSVAPYRTNIGIVARNAALAEVIVYDAAGREVERMTLATPGGVAQSGVTRAVTNGRATVRFVEGRGHAYASLVDGRSGDATFVAGQ